MKRYLMITGSYPPDVCGVGDYTACFMNEADKGKWNLFYSSSWKLSSLIKIIRNINNYKCDKLILQYPTQGYGWSFVPQLLCLYYTFLTSKKFIVVLHEFSQRTFKAKLASLFFLFANKIIFTNEFERDNIVKHFMVSTHKMAVIKIISNICAVPSIKTWEMRNIDIAYFGHLRPHKGLEDFFSVVSKIKIIKKDINVNIVGQVLPEFELYLNDLLKKNKSLNIKLRLNLDSHQVAEVLNNSKITFLPFPDGLSERRGSFLAAISNGTLVVSYEGKFTTKELKKTFISTNFQSAHRVILDILTDEVHETFNNYLSKSSFYLKNNIPSSWQDIVLQYEKKINDI